jgi:hypothetical protein
VDALREAETVTVDRLRPIGVDSASAMTSSKLGGSLMNEVADRHQLGSGRAARELA